MIKVIKHGKAPRISEHYQITCSNCKTIFECDSNDCSDKYMGHGFIAHTITCPVCKQICFDWQGGSDKWSVIND